MKIILCLTKDKNFKENLIFLKKKNIIILKNNNRKIFNKSKKKYLYILIIKNKNFKLYLKKNIIDLLFLGEDIILNNFINIFYNYKFLKINKFFISIISNKNYIFNKKNKINFSTKYKNILKNYLETKNIRKNINCVDGSIENDCIFNKNKIFDIVSSGKTIKENNIFEIKKILIFKNILLINKNTIYNKIFKLMYNKYVKK